MRTERNHGITDLQVADDRCRFVAEVGDFHGTPRDLRRLPFDQPYAGIRQHTLEELEESLRQMQRVYAEALSAGNRERARYCRRQVIGAKDRAKYLVRNPRTAPEKKAQKEEMVQWMLVWLENPAVFPAWAEARMTASHVRYFRP